MFYGARPRASAGTTHVDGVDFSADGTLMVSASRESARAWDVQTGRGRALLLAERTMFAQFTLDGSTLWTSGASGVQRWPLLRRNHVTGSMRLGPPTVLGERTGTQMAALSRDGRTLVVMRNGTAHIWDTRSRALRARLPGQWGDAPVAVSPDGRWVATNAAEGGRV
jgi:WD40 repeat protein